MRARPVAKPFSVGRTGFVPAPTAGDVTANNYIRADGAWANPSSSHTHSPEDIEGTAVVTSDARLSDARTPTAHSHAIDDVTGLTSALSGKEPANANIQAHIASSHAPTDAQKNSDITKEEIEAKLTGEISSHTHAGGSAPTFANGGNVGVSATPATTGAMTVVMDTAVKTITPTGACTFNASGFVVGQIVTFAVTTSGTSSFVLTWGTGFRRVGTLATGTASGRFFSVTFRCVSASIWQEIGRTAAQT